MFKLKFIASNEIDELAKKAGRTCGDCTLCCELLEVEELKIPARCKCPHEMKHGGCAIYQTRPSVCRDFACKWLVDPTFDEIWTHTEGFVLNGGIKIKL